MRSAASSVSSVTRSTMSPSQSDVADAISLMRGVGPAHRLGELVVGRGRTRPGSWRRSASGPSTSLPMPQYRIRCGSGKPCARAEAREARCRRPVAVLDPIAGLAEVAVPAVHDEVGLDADLAAEADELVGSEGVRLDRPPGEVGSAPAGPRPGRRRRAIDNRRRSSRPGTGCSRALGRRWPARTSSRRPCSSAPGDVGS